MGPAREPPPGRRTESRWPSATTSLRITATDSAGNTGSATLTVDYDTTPPSVAITSPTTNSTYLTSSGTVALSGTASDSAGIAQILWSNSTGGNGTCSGTTSWSATGIALTTGDNVITITATDSAGNTGSATLTVDYNTSPPISIGQARHLSPGSPAYISGAVVTATTIDSAGVTVESLDRSSGIELITGQALSVGQVVSFGGFTARVGGEYEFNNVAFSSITAGTPLTPLGMTTIAIGDDATETLNYAGHEYDRSTRKSCWASHGDRHDGECFLR